MKAIAKMIAAVEDLPAPVGVNSANSYMATESPLLQYFLSAEAKAAGIKFSPPREGDAGFDVSCLGAVEIEAGDFTLIPTGLHLAVPVNWVALIRDRSSVALRGGVVSAGVIDASYRGEVKVAMHNLSKQPLKFATGDRIAQCLLLPHLPGTRSLEVNSIESLGATERGAGGFGSTGK